MKVYRADGHTGQFENRQFVAGPIVIDFDKGVGEVVEAPEGFPDGFDEWMDTNGFSLEDTPEREAAVAQADKERKDAAKAQKAKAAAVKKAGDANEKRHAKSPRAKVQKIKAGLSDDEWEARRAEAQAEAERRSLTSEPGGEFSVIDVLAAG